jgi:iron complex outermembrane receptor protein
MDFRNGLTFADDGTGNFVRANGGETRFQGFEVESRYQWSPQFQLAMHYAYHDAQFVRFTRDNGADAAGNRFEMSPRHLGGVGLIYTAATGFGGSLVADYVGDRKLNKSNTVEAGGYTTVDASLSYRFGKYHVQLSGYNLTDRRDPVAESELSEAVTVTGTAGYYRLPGRHLEISVAFAP